jgi:DNA-binding transcriptional MerR regulator
MSEQATKAQLPPIPAKRYFTIGEVSELCGVKPHVLRYWEQEFTQLKPVKRRGNRRYYQHHEVLLIRRIRELLYEQGFTISGARNRLDSPDGVSSHAEKVKNENVANSVKQQSGQVQATLPLLATENQQFDFVVLRSELRQILNLLRPNLSAS